MTHSDSCNVAKTDRRPCGSTAVRHIPTLREANVFPIPLLGVAGAVVVELLLEAPEHSLVDAGGRLDGRPRYIVAQEPLDGLQLTPQLTFLAAFPVQRQSR